MVLDATLLSTQLYKVRIKGKVEHSWKWSTVISYKVFLSNTNNFQTDLLYHMRLTVSTTPYQGGLGSNSNEEVLHPSQNWSLIIRYSLMSYSGHFWEVREGSYPLYRRCCQHILSPINTTNVKKKKKAANVGIHLVKPTCYCNHNSITCAMRLQS